jgi:ribosomal protein L40E
MIICRDLLSGTGCGARNADTAQFCCQCGRELRSLRFPMRLHNPGTHIRHYRIQGARTLRVDTSLR